MVYLNISGSGKIGRKLRVLWDLRTQDLENFRVVGGNLETTDRSRWLEEDEKIYWDTDTGEVRIKKNV